MDEEDLEALEELRNFQLRAEESLKKETLGGVDGLICECKCLSIGDIEDALTTGNIKTVDLDFLRERLGLGSGCSSCLKSFQSWKGKIFASRSKD